MAKIPKNLSDKDMLKDWKEEETVEDVFLKAAEKTEKAAKEKSPAADISIAYLTPDIVEKLGKLLLELKVKLYNDGITDYIMDARLAGRQIILVPVERGKK